MQRINNRYQMVKKFCCDNFESHYSLPNQASPNIRVVKFVSDWLTNGVLRTQSEKLFQEGFLMSRLDFLLR